MSKPEVSLILPSIRTERLPKLYETILKSTKRDFELVICGPNPLPEELKEKRKTEKLTHEEESLRNLMLEKMHDNGDFERCVCDLTEHFDTTQRWL